MKRPPRLDRRRVLAQGAAGLGAALLGGCDRLADTDAFQTAFDLAENFNLRLQRLLLPADKLAPEYAEADISPSFKVNGSDKPADPEYEKHAKAGFARWSLEVGGLVEKPAKFTLAQLRAMPSRTQITRHDCVEGWSCIGKWTGVQLGTVLREVGVKPQARFVIFYCADALGAEEDGSDDEPETDSGQAGAKDQGGQTTSAAIDTAARGIEQGKYYESIDLADAYHPQTLLAYAMNDQPLPIPHGAPIRLRLERQLGYKMAKFIMRIELAESYAGLGQGKGGYWEDRGYEWYAGI